ncbi:MAG: nucleotidyltransferase domain-containing protein, partial [bacterium]
FMQFIKAEGLDFKSAYLFGSYAVEKYRKDSDIDLALIVDNSIKDIFDEQIKLMRIAARFEYPIIEPHPISEKDFKDGNPFVNEILKTGIRIA